MPDHDDISLETARKHLGWFNIQHWRPSESGPVLVHEEQAFNELFNEGEYLFLDVVLRNGTAPASFYMGMMSNALATLPAKSSTLASLDIAGPYELNNSSDPGYTVRGTVARSTVGWPVLSLAGGDYQATSIQVTFTATGNFSDVIRWMFLTTVATAGDTTGKLIAIAQLSADRTLLNGDSLAITYNLKQT